MSAEVTLADVARRAGVSLATASRVLNGSARRVGDRLCESVREAAKELDYVPNLNAQALARARTAIAGIVVHDLADPYFAEILRGISRVARDAGQLILVCNAERDPERELSYVRLLHAQRAATIVLTGSGRDDPDYNARSGAALQQFIARGGRVVAIGRHGTPVDSIRPDNHAGASELGTYLRGLGHRNVGVIEGPRWLTSVGDRRAGLRESLAGPLTFVEGDFTRASGARALDEIFERDPRTTAVVAFNDEMALGALGAVRARGLRVPEDVSLTGFGDIPVCADVSPALTSVAIPMNAMGERAMQLALEPVASEARVEVVRLQLNVRASTGPPQPR